jgi:hypothetical protein
MKIWEKMGFLQSSSQRKIDEMDERTARVNRYLVPFKWCVMASYDFSELTHILLFY